VKTSCIKESCGNGVRALAIAAAMLAVSIGNVSAQQAYPDKPVRIVVAFAAGGFADTVSRIIGQKLGDRLGQPFLVENRPGAGGNIAAKYVAEAAPDGYTLLAHTAASAINVTLYDNAGFDLLNDLAPVANTGSTPGLFAVLVSNPARDLRDLIRMSRGRRLTYATAGVGTSSHISADYLFRVASGLDAVHVPFKGGGPATVAVLGNQVTVLSSSSNALPYIRQGKMKALAVASLKRVEALPDVPTVAELGFPGYEERSWVGIFAPAKTPPAVVEKLNSEINRILALPEVRASLASQGMDVHPGSVADFADYVRAEVAKWSKMIKSTGVTLE
jgi:tripartite-type tricarboxylate transporter receptor subunit TctC